MLMATRGARRVLVVCPHPEGVAPGQRLKYEQYFGYLRKNGFDITVSPFMTPAFWRIIYAPGRFPQKIFWTLRGYLRRVADLFRLRSFDCVYIFLWVTPFGSTFFERLYRLLAKRVIFDIDDLVFLGRASPANSVIARFKGRSKPAYLAKVADHVITCTPYLDEYVRQWTDKTTDISSTIDTDLYIPRPRRGGGEPLVLGWSGSLTTSAYLHLLDPILAGLARELPLRLLVIGDPSFRLQGVEVEALPWRLETEVADLNRIDIGLYPLPDDLWVQGKSGLKALQYMALEIPTVASAVGANFRVIEDGVSGFLVKNGEEWTSAILRLARDPGLRRSVGEAARRRVLERFSVKANRDAYLRILREVCSRP